MEEYEILFECICMKRNYYVECGEGGGGGGGRMGGLLTCTTQGYCFKTGHLNMAKSIYLLSNTFIYFSMKTYLMLMEKMIR